MQSTKGPEVKVKVISTHLFTLSDCQHFLSGCVCENKEPAGEDTGAISTFFDALEDLDELLLYRRRHQVLDENIGRIGVSISMCFSPPLHYLSSSMLGVARCPYRL